MLGIKIKNYNLLEKLNGSQMKKMGQKSYVITGGAVLTIIILHFVLQFSFIQSENIRIMQDLTKVEQFDESEEIAEKTVEKIVVSATENKAKSEDTSKSNVKTAPKAEYNVKKTKIIKKPKFASPSLQIRPKTAQSRTVKKKKRPQETRAQRLRRTERILTGI